MFCKILLAHYQYSAFNSFIGILNPSFIVILNSSKYIRFQFIIVNCYVITVLMFLYVL